MRIAMALLLALVLCAAKAVIGQDFDATQLTRLEVGRSTVEDATHLLGVPPTTTVAGKSGAIGYQWDYIATSASMWTGKVRSSSKSVLLVFNQDGTFQRILRMQGVTLPPDDLRRLMTSPSATAAAQ